jgi:hypothetical protein
LAAVRDEEPGSVFGTGLLAIFGTWEITFFALTDLSDAAGLITATLQDAFTRAAGPPPA